MANFQMTITDAGLALLAAGMDGEALCFTKFIMGDAAYSGNLAQVTQVVSPRFTLPIGQITRRDSQVTIKGILTFRSVSTGFTWRELGLYAKDPSGGEDILYAYGNAGEEGDYIPGADETTLNERVLQLTVAVNSASNVTAEIGGSGIFVTYEEMEAALDDLGLVVLNHSKSGSVHQFTGLEGRTGLLLARFLANGSFSDGDTATVDGVSYQMQTTDGNPLEDGMFITGAGVEMVIDTGEKMLNFKTGGGLIKSKLALANATEDTVFNGRTFYAGDRTLRTGRALSVQTTAAARDILAGKTAYNNLGQLITGTGRTVIAGSIGPPIEYKTYTIPYGNSLGKPKAIVAYFNVWVGGYATSGQQPSFSPYYFRGAVSGQLNGITSATSGTMRNQNQSSANTTITVGSDSFSVTFSKYDYVSGSEFCYILIW